MIEEWVEEEFESLDLGDDRLNRRAKMFVSSAAGIGDSNPDRFRDRGSLKATYRMINNPKVDVGELFASHNRASIKRCSEQSLVYVVQDTTEVDLTKPKIEVAGGGPLSCGKRRGFFFHPSYALSSCGVPLGQVDQIIWARDPQSLEVPFKERRSRLKKACFEEKESARWLEVLQSNEQLARSLPETRIVSVADSEADISELFCQCEDFPDNFDLIIRGCRKHNLISATDSANSGRVIEDVSNIDEALQTATARFAKDILVGPRPEPLTPDAKNRTRNQARTARTADLTISAITVTLAGPRRPGGGCLPNSTLNVVQVLEASPPEGEPPVHWVLYTTLPVGTKAEVHAVIDGYCQRWNVELYFKTLKSGLKIEDMKYRTLERYLKAFALLAVVAWRVEYLKTAARIEPDAPCSKYFPERQWVPIVIFQTQTAPDKEHPPTLQQFMKMIAMLGGYINKKSQGPPGSKTIWRGMSRFETIVKAFQTYSQTCGV
jgi:hypothetical protein